MTRALIFLYIGIIMLDLISLLSLRKLVYSFLLTKRNIKGAKKIHIQQTRIDRFTLSYISEFAVYKKEFKIRQKILVAYYIALIPQYSILTVISILSKHIAVVFCGALLCVKFVIETIICLEFDSKRFSKFDKRYGK